MTDEDSHVSRLKREWGVTESSFKSSKLIELLQISAYARGLAAAAAAAIKAQVSAEFGVWLQTEVEMLNRSEQQLLT